jgi:CspA family cold shock protein
MRRLCLQAQNQNIRNQGIPMPLPAAIITSLVIAAVASTAIVLIQGGALPDWPLLLTFAVACVASALLARAGGPVTATTGADDSAHYRDHDDSDTHYAGDDTDADRVEGNVKWFNVSKGYGFITLDDGDEIFVHFRSIRGEGRRSLKDGQRVSLRVAQSDKGPQAEDVAAIGSGS